MIVPVRHPVHVDHVPRRARTPRRTVVSTTSPVEVPEARESEFTRVDAGIAPTHSWRSDANVFIREGVAYRRLLRTIGGPALDPEAFLGFLRSVDVPGDRDARHGLWLETRGTPLNAAVLVPGPVGTFRADHSFGEAIPDESIGRVLRDDRPRASSDLADFLAREVLVAGDGVYRRWTPIVSLADRTPELVDVPRVESSLDREPRLGMMIPARADHSAECQAFWGMGAKPPAQEVSRLVGALPASAFGNGDLVIVANHLPGTVRMAMERVAWPGSRAGGEPEVRAAHAVLVELERLGSTGGIRPGAMPEAFAAIRTGLGIAMAVAGRQAPASVAAIDRYVAGHVGRRLGTPDPGASLDEEDIAGLAP